MRAEDQSGGRRRLWWVAIVSAAVLVVALVSAVTGFGDGDPSASPDDAAPTSSDSPPATPSSPADPSSGPADAPSSEPGQTRSPKATPEEGDSALSEDVSAEVTLRLPEGEGRCLVPNARALGKRPVAVQATVTEVDRGAGTVLLDVDHWYAAEGIGDGSTIMVRKPPGSVLDSMIPFREGKTYLVAATQDATVMLCGFSGAKTASLTRMYRQAFE